MFKKIALATALIAGLGNAYAYQTEVGASYHIVDYDNAGTGNTFGVDGTYYFNPVQEKNYPLNEAAFLNRASNVSLNASYTDGSPTDETTVNGGIEYFVPNSDFYVGAGVGYQNWDFPTGDLDRVVYNAEVGYLPAPGLLVAAGIIGYDDDYNDDIDATLRAKYVTNLSGYDMNFEANTSFGSVDHYGVAADLYLDKTLSVGLGYNSDFDRVSDDVITVRAKKFFNQQVSLEGGIGFGDDDTTYGIRGGYRF